MTERLPAVFDKTAAQYPEKTALQHKKNTLSYAELASQSDALAARLVERGVQPGQCVGILADHGIEPVVIFWAILKAGAIAVHLNESLQTEGLADILNDCGPVLIFSSSRYAEERLASVFRREAVLLIEEDYPSLVADSDLKAPDHQGVPGDIATIIYTSGSTGRPKGVCLSHRGLLLVANADAALMNISAQDSYLMLVPLHYVHGVLQLLIHLLNGASIHFAGGFLFPRTVIKQLAETKATGFSGVPFHLIALLDRAGFGDAELPSLRWMAVTGGKFPVSRIKQLREAQPDIAVYVTYGQTECSPRITALDAAKIDRKPESVGAAPSGIDVRVVDEEGRALSNGEVGEVVVKGDNLMVGYWNDQAGTETVIDKDGWLHTGDLGRFDEEGDLFLAGRKQAMIKSAGERIFPEEIEQIIVTHPAVAEVAVVGVPDPLYGQRIEAHIQPAQNTDEEIESAIRSYCLERMPFARAPKAYHLHQQLPRKANGKIDRQQLLESGTAADKAGGV